MGDKSVGRYVNLEQLEARILKRFNVQLSGAAREALAEYEAATGLIRKYAEARDHYRDIVIANPDSADEAEALECLKFMSGIVAPLVRVPPPGDLKGEGSNDGPPG